MTERFTRLAFAICLWGASVSFVHEFVIVGIFDLLLAGLVYVVIMMQKSF